MNVFDFLAVCIICIFGMVTIVSCRVAARRAQVKIAEANGNRPIYVDGATGEVAPDPEDDPNMGVNQTGKWAPELRAVE